jgi:class 3 adenylate cyclase/CRP-like cAMP-binding protein
MEFMVKAVLTFDIVDFSTKTPPEQMNAVEAFIEILRKAIPEEHNDDNGRVWSPAGDGGSVTFLKTIEPAVDTALSLGKLVHEFNSGDFVSENGRKLPKPVNPLELRTGIHLGPVAKKTDFDGRENIWGDGINMSARVMGLAKPGQILISENFYKMHNWSSLTVTPIGKWWAKHHTAMNLYNVYSKDKNIGIPPSDVDEWFGPFHHPLEQAITMYQAMAMEEAHPVKGNAFRAAVLAKRLLDLDPQHAKAKEIIKSISDKSSPFHSSGGGSRVRDEFFSPLSPEALTHFFESSKFEVFERGQYIVKEGDKAESMMMVVSGVIHPYIGGKRIKGHNKEDSKNEIEVILGEGNVIGEMGLFNPGEKRTATLKAFKQTITLGINYSHLKPVEVNSKADLVENRKRNEIEEQIWKSYTSRSTINQINGHRLFQDLTSDERYRLFRNHQFLPKRHHDQGTIQLSAQELWDMWVIVVAGKFSIECSGKSGNRKKIYRPGDHIGPLRAGMSGDNSPYQAVEISDDAHFISFDWEFMEELINESDDFGDTCYKQSRREKKFFDIR